MLEAPEEVGDTDSANCDEIDEVVMLGANGAGVTLSTSNAAFSSKIVESYVVLIEGV